MSNILDVEYKNWLLDLKSKIRYTQAKAAITVNTALVTFYWDLGKVIAEKENIWGSKLIEQVAKDLQAEFPDMKGLSRTNLSYAKQFYTFYESSIVQQPVGQIPWGHNILIFSKSKSIEEAHFYLLETIENGWSREVLALQIKSQLYQRQGKAITNFKHTLSSPLSNLAQQTLKDPYIFDFLSMTKPYHEKDIEDQLVGHITKFLLELGKGFAFIGRQYHLHVGDTDY
jgi:predicted nuclease of restriction endonuclease-like (RecB) superfamily